MSSIKPSQESTHLGMGVAEVSALPELGPRDTTALALWIMGDKVGDKVPAVMLPVLRNET